MKKGLMNNWGLKILSFLLAVMLWLIVVNIDDPVTTQTFNNIPVAVTNAEVLAATNQTYQIEDGTQNVSVTVRAKRSVLNKIKADNIKATADMKELTLQTQIPISVEITGVNYESVEVSPRNLQVKLEDEETKKFPIVPKTTGTVRDGYTLGEIQAVPEMVSIRGPKSVIDSISKVEASVSVSGLSEDVVTKSELVLYDSDNNVIDQSLLANNLGTEGVSVSVQVLETKSVKVEFDTSQITAADGYSVSDIKYEPDHVNVTGRAEELKKLKKISVPASALIDSISKVEASVSVSGLSEDVVTKSELVLYDSDNNVIDQSLLANNLGTEGVSVSVQVLETKSVKVEFDTSQITAADGYSVSDIKYEPDHVNVTGRAEELKKLKKISVPASALNMSGLTSKTEKVVDITDYLPEDISLTDENAGSVVVTVGIDKDGTKSYDISMGAIKVNNLANGLSLSYESADVLEIQIRGPGDILDQYKISDNVSIDLKNYQTAGTYTVPVTVGVPDGCVLESTVSVNVILEEK